MGPSVLQFRGFTRVNVLPYLYISQDKGKYNNIVETFVGYNDDTLCSLVLTLPTPKVVSSESDDAIFDDAVNRLIWIATPESVVRGAKGEGNTDYTKMYFEQQIHSDLPTLLSFVAFIALDGEEMQTSEEVAAKVTQLKAELEGAGLDKEKLAAEMTRIDEEWGKVQAEVAKREQESNSKKISYWPEDNASIGAQLMVMTYSPVSDDVEKVIRTCNKDVSLSVLKLHEFSSSSELTTHVQSFFNNDHEDHDEAILVIQCDPIACSAERIKHAKYIIEQERADHINKKSQQTEKPKLHSKKSMEGDVKGKAEEPEKPRKIVRHKHVLVLIHLNRGHATTFAFDFEKNWFAAFLDDLKPDSMLLRYIPKTTELLRGTEMELLQRIQLKHALRDSFRTCLARLIYPYQRYFV